MTVHSGALRLPTSGDGEIVDITEGVVRVLAAGEVDRGVVNVFAVGSTVAVTTMEYEPGGVADLRGLLERLVPSVADYEHNRRNHEIGITCVPPRAEHGHDTNAHAHLRAAVIGPSESIPVIGGLLALGTRQQIVLWASTIVHETALCSSMFYLDQPLSARPVPAWSEG